MAFVPALVLAALFAAAAFAGAALTIDGAVAASVVGGLALAAGWSWALVLLAFFIGSSALSRIGPPRHEPAGAKTGPRDAAQVLANGGIPAAAGLAHLLGVPGPWPIIFSAALATANADTWATEIGRHSRSAPRLITTARRVSPGVSGGVTLLGTLGACAGAAAIASVCALAGLLSPGDASRIACAGLAGAMCDSILGATIQERRFCPACDTITEQTRHRLCGTPTYVVSGISGLNNDTINFVASGVGVFAGLALLAAA